MAKQTVKQFFTKYEVARLVGARALQISCGAPILVKLDEAKLASINYNPVEIAKMEFDRDLLPITVVRPMPKKVE